MKKFKYFLLAFSFAIVAVLAFTSDGFTKTCTYHHQIDEYNHAYKCDDGTWMTVMEPITVSPN